MAVSLKHNFVSAVSDGGDSNLVQPSNWNEEHVLTLGASKILGRYTGTTGAAQEITPSTGLNLDSGTGNLTVTIGTDVQAYDATLNSIASLGTAADKLAYTTGVDTWAETAITSFGRSLIDDADAAAARTTLGLELYAESLSSPISPSATGINTVAIGDGAISSGGIAIGTNASTTSGLALGFSATSSATQGTAIGYQAIVQSGSYATALTRSYASGADSFAVAITNAFGSYGATGANSVAIGYQAKATGADSIAIGDANISSAQGSTTFGGAGNTASASYSLATGYQSLSSIVGKSARASGQFSAQGDAQTGIFVFRSDTTDATPEALTTNNSAAGTTNQIILPNNSAYAFHGTIVAREQASAGTDCAAWKIEGLIRREGSAGTTVLVNSATTVIDNTPSWGLALSADTTNGGLKIEVTGAAATNIRWVATIHTSEVTY